MARILTVDDEPVILNILNKILISGGHDVSPAKNGAEAMKLIDSDQFDLLISDINMEPVNGMEVLRYAREKSPETQVVMLTAFGTVSTAVEAMKAGAYDYITKPFKLDELQLTVQRALEYQSILAENKGLKARLQSKNRLDNIVGDSPAMQKVCAMIEKVAPTDNTVLIHGESGTGKELVANALHNYSNRKSSPFVAINCAALPEPLMESEMFGHVKGAFTGATSTKEGLFETANGGTLFLDEIGSMPMSIQSKLLRVLQDMQIRKVGGTQNIKVDVRLIAASNERLETLIKQGTFREDLYYRLSVITIDIPPLRERPSDILPLIQHFLSTHGNGQTQLSIDHNAESILENHSWPGNIRELQNVIQHAVTFAENNTITPASLPAKLLEQVDTNALSALADISSSSQAMDFRCKSLKAFLRAKEKEYLGNVMQNLNGDKEKAAQALNISVATLYRKLSDKDS